MSAAVVRPWNARIRPTPGFNGKLPDIPQKLKSTFRVAGASGRSIPLPGFISMQIGCIYLSNDVPSASRRQGRGRGRIQTQIRRNMNPDPAPTTPTTTTTTTTRLQIPHQIRSSLHLLRLLEITTSFRVAEEGGRDASPPKAIILDLRIHLSAHLLLLCSRRRPGPRPPQLPHVQITHLRLAQHGAGGL